MARLHRPAPQPARHQPPQHLDTHADEANGAALITADLLLVADPSNSRDYYEAIAGSMDACASAYEIDTPLRVAHFLAQIGHESHFRSLEENGNYSPTRMREIFGCNGGPTKYDKQTDECKIGAAGRQRPKLWTEEARYAHNPANLLSYVYAARLGNSDEASGDGFRYRGRGFIQLTFKSNYRDFTVSHNRRQPNDPQDFVANPELLVTQSKYAMESAFYFWDTRNVNGDADHDDLEDVTRKINGGLNGLSDRRARLERIKQAMGI